MKRYHHIFFFVQLVGYFPLFKFPKWKTNQIRNGLFDRRTLNVHFVHTNHSYNINGINLLFSLSARKWLFVLLYFWFGIVPNCWQNNAQKLSIYSFIYVVFYSAHKICTYLRMYLCVRLIWNFLGVWICHEHRLIPWMNTWLFFSIFRILVCCDHDMNSTVWSKVLENVEQYASKLNLSFIDCRDI